MFSASSTGPPGPGGEGVQQLPGAAPPPGAPLAPAAGGVYTEDSVRSMVLSLYFPSAGSTPPAEANCFLVEFQQQQAAWPICISVLNKFALSFQQKNGNLFQLSPEEECLLYFASQTLATQARAGFPQQIDLLLSVQMGTNTSEFHKGGMTEIERRKNAEKGVFRELRQGLVQLLFSCRHAPQAVVRQLAVALSAALVFGAASSCPQGCEPSDGEIEGGGMKQRPPTLPEVALEEILVALGQKLGEEGAGPLLEVLVALPQEVCSQRLSLAENTRLKILRVLVQKHSASALSAAASVFEYLERKQSEDLHAGKHASTLAQVAALKTACVTGIRSWISAHLSALSMSAVSSEASDQPFFSTTPLFSFLVPDGPSPSPLRVLQALSSRSPGFLSGPSPGSASALSSSPSADQAQVLDAMQATGEAVACLAALAADLAASVRVRCEEEGQVGSGNPSASRMERRKQDEREKTACRTVMEQLVQAYASACKTTKEEANRTGYHGEADFLQALFSSGVLELAKEALPAFLHGDPWWPLSPPPFSRGDSSSQHHASFSASPRDRSLVLSLQTAAQQICGFAADVLLRHESLGVKTAGLDFFYNLLFHFVSLVSHQQELFVRAEKESHAGLQHPFSQPGGAAAGQTAASRGSGERSNGATMSSGTLQQSEDLEANQHEGKGVGEADANVDSQAVLPSPTSVLYAQVSRDVEERRQRLFPVFEHFVNVLMSEVGPPTASAVIGEEVDLERWGRFRDEAAVNLTEATLVLGHEHALERAGNEIHRLLQEHQNPSGNNGGLGKNTSAHKEPSSSSAEPWQRLEACLFVLATVAPRAPAGEDRVIPACLEVLPKIPYESLLQANTSPTQRQTFVPAGGQETKLRGTEEERDVAALFLHTAAGRFVLWTAGYAGRRKFLFASLFHFLACTSLPYILKMSQKLKKSGVDSGSSVWKAHTLAEEVVVEAMKALVACAAPVLAAEAAEEDVNVVLNSIVNLVLEEDLSIDSRASLVQAAGAVLAPTSPDRMRHLHGQLLNSLGQNLREVLARPESSSTSYKNAVKLFFSALQGLRPSRPLPLPSPSASGDVCAPLPQDSPFRHPVLDVAEAHWETIEAAMKNPRRQEHLFEQSCYSLVAVVSTCRPHVPHYLLLFRFLDTLAETFAVNSTAYHLGALRTMEGLFGNGPEEQILDAVCACLRRCVLATLQRIQTEGEQYIYRQPDLVGMTVDCVNIALLHPLLTVRFVAAKQGGGLVGEADTGGDATSVLDPSQDWFHTLAFAVLQFTPTCHHPKVLHTFMVFFSRLAGWTDPPSQIHSLARGAPVPWLLEAAERAQQAVLALLLRPLPPSICSGFSNGNDASTIVNFLTATIQTHVQALTSVHVAVQSWIGNAAQTLALFLHLPQLHSHARASLEASVMGLPSNLLTVDQRRAFLRRAFSETDNIRGFCLLLQQLADDAKAQFQRSKFCAAPPITSSGLTGLREGQHMH